MTKIKPRKISDEDIRKLVVARLRTLSGNKRVSIGSDGEFTKEELIKNVEENSHVGRKIIQIQLEYLQAFKKGLFFQEKVDANNSAKSRYNH
jgi:hypothetical protein